MPDQNTAAGDQKWQVIGTGENIEIYGPTVWITADIEDDGVAIQADTPEANPGLSRAPENPA